MTFRAHAELNIPEVGTTIRRSGHDYLVVSRTLAFDLEHMSIEVSLRPQRAPLWFWDLAARDRD
jgi:hypothetical protein